jgi:hypothetical protein
MKSFWCVLALVPAFAVAAGRPAIELPSARFATGDDPAWSRPDFDDRAWREISTRGNFEQQGYTNYNGFAWYRIHVRIPASFRDSAQWRERLRVFLSTIDDVDETYFNGVRIGQTGRMPEDPAGYDTKWQAEREYFVDASHGLVRWDQDNVIAVRVFDGSGGGGFYKGVPALTMVEKVDGIHLATGDAEYRYTGRETVISVLPVRNQLPVAVGGRLQYEVRDLVSGRRLSRGARIITLGAGEQQSMTVRMPQRPGITVSYRFTEATAGLATEAEQIAPYLLTPPEPLQPRINGAQVVGVRAGTPFMFRIAASGKRPLQFSAANLPAGLSLDAASGIISGSPNVGNGDYRVQLRVENAQGSARRELTIRIGAGLSLTPPMGWNSWNVHGLGVTDQQVRAAALAMVTTGLADHGWTYVNVDDGWQAEKRDAAGVLRGNAKFPDMAGLGGFVHAQGLKFGIYSSPGPLTCGRYLGSQNFERQDAATYAGWGVDYLKYDQCSYSELLTPDSTLEDFQRPYRLMGAALQAQTRDILYSLCQYGEREVWTWGKSVGGHSWRVSGDIEDTWQSVLETGFKAVPAMAAVAPGAWADPDMLVVGRVGWGGALHASRLTPDEQYSHISLWSLQSAPLLLGNDLTTLDPLTRNLLTNDEVLAVNQDSSGRPARRVLDLDSWQIWVKELADGNLAIGVFNLSTGIRVWNADLSSAGVPPGTALRDLWRQRDLGRKPSAAALTIPAHGVLLMRVRRG